MVSPSEELKLWFAAEIETSIAKIYPNSGLEIQQILNSISTPKKEFGDISSAVAIKLAKVAKKNPKDVAQEIAKGIQKTQMILEVNAIGGYINALFNEVE